MKIDNFQKVYCLVKQRENLEQNIASLRTAQKMTIVWDGKPYSLRETFARDDVYAVFDHLEGHFLTELSRIETELRGLGMVIEKSTEANDVPAASAA